MLSVRALRLFGALTGLARADPSVLARQAPAPCLRTLQQHSWGVGSLQRSYAQLTQATSNTSRPAGSSRRPLYPPLDLADRVVLLTEAGCKLVLLARRTEKLAALQKKLQEEYKVPIHTVTLDVRDLDSIAALPSQLPSEFAEVDILVNNAGLALGVAPVTDIVREDMLTMLQTNVAAVMEFTRAFAPPMVQRNRGHIVNISSVAGHESYSGGGVYCATKFAVDAYTTATRHDLVASSNVRVSAISPGAVNTDFSTVRFAGDKAKADAVYQGIVPLYAEDVADNVMYVVTRPEHVQIGEVIVWATLQCSAKGLARVLK